MAFPLLMSDDSPCAADDSTASSAPDARVSFRQPVTSEPFVDAAWWPRSRDLAAELPALLDVLWTADREVDRVSYPIDSWYVNPPSRTPPARNDEPPRRRQPGLELAGERPPHL